MNNDGYFTQGESIALLVVTKVFSAISIIASFGIFYMYWKYRELRNFNHEIVLWLSISNSLYCASSFLPYDGKAIDFACGLQSYILTCFQNASLAWSCIIGYSSYINVIENTHLENNRKKYRLIFLIVSFGISGLFALMYILFI